jgi:hypothetical protein
VRPAWSWLRDTTKLFIQYLGVAGMSIPATGAYYVLLGYVSSRVAMGCALVVGFACSYAAWQFVGNRLLAAPSNGESTAASVVQFSPVRSGGLSKRRAILKDVNRPDVSAWALLLRASPLTVSFLLFFLVATADLQSWGIRGMQAVLGSAALVGVLGIVALIPKRHFSR